MIKKDLTSIYKEIMWLARRPKTTPAVARSWCTRVVSERLKKDVRRFTGKVSENALKEGETLRLEHFKRMQTTLTKLVDHHVKTGVRDAEEFVRVVHNCEQVHIVTLKENYEIMKKKGSYKNAGVVLVKWKDISKNMQHFL